MKDAPARLLPALFAPLAFAACAAAPPESACPVDPTFMISDFETGLASVEQEMGRGASGWYVYNDETGEQLPREGQVAASEGGACNTRFALRTQGRNFAVWGAGVGTDIAVDPFNIKAPYNASRYKGVRLWARSGMAGANIRIKVQDQNTIPEGGVCLGAECNDNFGANVDLTAQWQKIDLLFADMKQEGWGKAFPAIQSDRVMGIQVQTKGPNFDIWIDEVSFF